MISACDRNARSKLTLATVHGVTITDATFFYNGKACDIDDPKMIEMTGVRFETY